MPIDIGGALAGVGSFFGNQISSAINSSRAWKYTQKAMALQDELNRNYYQWSGENGPTFNRTGMERAGFNPLLAIGQGTATGANYSQGFMNADSDAGDQAINSAMTAKVNQANIKNITAQTKKTDAETKGIELQNKRLKNELNFSPKNIISDIVEGNDSPVVNTAKKVIGKIVDITGENNSATQTSYNVKKVAKSYLNNNYSLSKNLMRLSPALYGVTSAVPIKEVYKKAYKLGHSAGSALKKKDEEIGVWNSNRTFKGSYMSDSDVVNYSKRKYVDKYNNRPPMNFPSGM